MLSTKGFTTLDDWEGWQALHDTMSELYAGMSGMAGWEERDGSFIAIGELCKLDGAIDGGPGGSGLE